MYCPSSSGNTSGMCSLHTPWSKEVLKYRDGASCLLLMYHVTIGSGLPFTTASMVTGSPATTSLLFTSLTKSGGARCWKGLSFPLLCGFLIIFFVFGSSPAFFFILSVGKWLFGVVSVGTFVLAASEGSEKIHDLFGNFSFILF